MTTIPQNSSLRVHPTSADFTGDREESRLARSQQTREYFPLIQAVKDLFSPEEFDRLLPPIQIAESFPATSPLAKTEPIARDWLVNGGKRFRPFVTLAAYVARLGPASRLESPVQLPDPVKKAAIAIEAFHKASLVHDDIQDDDQYRYGVETLHRRYGVGQAINIGDYLIGMGYRLLADCQLQESPSSVGDIVRCMSLAHIKLCEGQGAEMTWTETPSLELTIEDAFQIYALKTSPAFEAALYSGLRLAGEMEPYEQLVPAFCYHLGVGFQILNDLKDWTGDHNNKLIRGQDVIAMRPTLLLALAFQGANSKQRQTLQQILTEKTCFPEKRLEELKQIFSDAEVFSQVNLLLAKCRFQAEQLADQVEPESLKQFLLFLVDTVLSPEEELASEPLS